MQEKSEYPLAHAKLSKGVVCVKTPDDLAKEHWQYTKEVIKAQNRFIDSDNKVSTGIMKAVIDLVGYHYKTAFVHGYKHGVKFVKGE